MLPGGDKTVTNFRQHCLAEKRGLSSNLLEMNYNISVYHVEKRVVDHPVGGGVPTTFSYSL